jgi:hypothetical protein
MSKRKWIRDELTGLPEGRDLNKQDVLSAQAMGCDILAVNSFAAVARYTPRHFTKIFHDSRSFFHAIPLHDDDGRIAGYATQTESAYAGGMIARAKGWAAHGAPINPSSAAALKEGLDAESYARHFADSQPVLLPIRC